MKRTAVIRNCSVAFPWQPLRFWRHRLGFCAFNVLFCALAFHSVGAARSPNPEEELRSGAEKFVRLVESRDQGALLKLFSEQGTSFIGTSYVPSKVTLTPAEVRTDFEAKLGVYCLFFDTECFRQEDAKERVRQKGRPLRIPLRSVVDLISTASQKRFVTYDVSKTNGKVSLLLSERTPDTSSLGEDALNFYFRFEDGQWKLRNIEYN